MSKQIKWDIHMRTGTTRRLLDSLKAELAETKEVLGRRNEEIVVLCDARDREREKYWEARNAATLKCDKLKADPLRHQGLANADWRIDEPIMKIKTLDATPSQINWLIAKINGYDTATMSARVKAMSFDDLREEASTAGVECERHWDIDSLRAEIIKACESRSPVSNWAHGGPLVDVYGVMFSEGECKGVLAHLRTVGKRYWGVNRLTAAMLAIICDELGDEVEVPDLAGKVDKQTCKIN